MHSVGLAGFCSLLWDCPSRAFDFRPLHPGHFRSAGSGQDQQLEGIGDRGGHQLSTTLVLSAKDGPQLMELDKGQGTASAFWWLGVNVGGTDVGCWVIGDLPMLNAM